MPFQGPRRMARILVLVALLMAMRASCPTYLAPRGLAQPTFRGASHVVLRSSRIDARELLQLAEGAPSQRGSGAAPAASARRSVTLGLAAALTALVASCCGPAARAAADPEVDVYFGAGNFFSMQHEFVMKEAVELGRREGDITSLAGYAGGKKAGQLERLCYSGLLGAPDHVSLGHAQVVRVTLPSQKIPAFTSTFLEQVAQRKKRETGSQYRAMLGIRGGMDSKYFPLIQEACEGKVQLVKGEGNEPDNFEQGTVYVYDARKFPWRPAESSNQFRDDPPTYYDRDYKEIFERQKKLGIILRTGCPNE